jgi:hypothetical protein
MAGPGDTLGSPRPLATPSRTPLVTVQVVSENSTIQIMHASFSLYVPLPHVGAPTPIWMPLPHLSIPLQI